jgi:hypothetical protein
MKMDERLTPSNIYELVAEVGFKKYFHLGGFAATRALIDLCPINEYWLCFRKDGMLPGPNLSLPRRRSRYFARYG